MEAQSALFAVFSVVILGFLAFDLGYLNRKSHRITLRSALYQSLFWIALALGFGFLVFLYMGKELSVQFFSAYMTEEMLSIDNLFVMLLIFNYFKLEEKYHHRVLFWGILGAIVFRAVFILAGAYLVHEFHWILYIFGIILVLTGASLLRDKKEEHVDLQHNRLLKAARRYLPVTEKDHGGAFFARENGKWRLTTLFLIMLLIEETDILFAVDSVPAVFTISQDTFIIFTSNIFAIMGLRSLFFLIESVLRRFHHLQKGLAFILLFIGAKMLAGIWDITISSTASLAFIVFALAASIVASVLFPKKHKLPLVGTELPF